MASDAFVLGPEDRALVDRVAARVAELRLEVPAILTLETARPLTVLAGQTMIFFEPVVRAFLRLPDYERFARLVEHRETIEALITAIEREADTAHEERRRLAAERRAARRSP